MFFPLAMFSQYIFGPALFLISVFIVLIILLQRGRGGGLTGALGGAGGASAFGVKAGDIFTRITAIAVLFWIVLCALTCYWYLPETLDIASDPGAFTSGEGAGSSGGENSNGPGTSAAPLMPSPTDASLAEPIQESATPNAPKPPASDAVTLPPVGLPPASTPDSGTPDSGTPAGQTPDLPPAVEKPAAPSAVPPPEPKP